MGISKLRTNSFYSPELNSFELDYYTFWSIADAPAYIIKADTVFLITGLLAPAGWLWSKKFRKTTQRKRKINFALGLGNNCCYFCALLFLPEIHLPKHITVSFAMDCP
jgi:hypothetical protein